MVLSGIELQNVLVFKTRIDKGCLSVTNANKYTLISNFFFKKGFFKKNNFKKNFFLLNRFLVYFLEFFFKKKITFFLKKCTSILCIKHMNSRYFYKKFFKKNLKISKKIIGLLYYSLLLKDVTVFLTFCKTSLESINLKQHKKFFLGLKCLIQEVFKPIFSLLGVYGVFFNVVGKIGTSGSSKKRRFFFYFNHHSLTNRTLKINYKPIQI